MRLIRKRIFIITTVLSLLSGLLLASCIDKKSTSSSKKTCTWGEKIELTDSNIQDHLRVDIDRKDWGVMVNVVTKSGLYAKFTDCNVEIDITFSGSERTTIPMTLKMTPEYVGTYDSVVLAFITKGNGYIQYLIC